MNLRFYNTLSREVEPFVPLDPENRVVSMYTCGPTVYAHAHIGNFRAYVFEDLLVRHLVARGYQVRRVMNLTDVDDKTIRGCRAANLPLAEFTRPFKDAFFEDLKTLNILPAESFPEATDQTHIEKMIEMIGLLIERDYAYQAEDQSVYFRISKFPTYGRLAHLNLEELRPTGRIRNDEYEKESVGDFALWKAWTEADGDVFWESPWGRGRPGWHIECSAMAVGLLGAKIDIHCGGVDNIFPHHEAEIAQAEACSGETFVRYWMHCAHLMVESQKMAKSAGNYFTLRDLIAEGWTGREVRYALISVKYRLPLNFTREGLAGARASLLRIDEWLERLRGLMVGDVGPEPFSASELSEFFDALDHDLNISEALAHLFNTIRETHRAADQGQLSAAEAAGLLKDWERINAVLALENHTQTIPSEITELAELRFQARKDKNWAESDRLRDALGAMGWVVKDGRDGYKLLKS